MYYFAYGSNLWRKQMASRCPENILIGNGRLERWRWIITTRGYASIVSSESDHVLGTVYELTKADEHNLDRFEGVAKNAYRKEIFQVDMNGAKLNCLVYIDQVVKEGYPKDEYIIRINAGIQDASLPEEYVLRYIRPFVPLKN